MPFMVVTSGINLRIKDCIDGNETKCDKNKYNLIFWWLKYAERERESFDKIT